MEKGRTTKKGEKLIKTREKNWGQFTYLPNFFILKKSGVEKTGGRKNREQFIFLPVFKLKKVHIFSFLIDQHKQNFQNWTNPRPAPAKVVLAHPV